MKVTAIIAEFNPFHSGHAWLIDYAKRVRGADYIVILMSGNFVQRGEPAIFDKFTRTRMALSCGADLVLELPTAFATASAREFARASAALADKTGLIDELLFGIEGISTSIYNSEQLSDAAQLDFLQEAALLLASESSEFQSEFRQQLAAGASYPRARAEAVSHMAGSKNTPEVLLQLLSKPNSILAVEYLQALHLRSSQIRPALALRQGDGYHANIPSGSPFASATALRQLLLSGKSVSAYVPDCLSAFYKDAVCIGPDALDLPLQQRLLAILYDGADFERYADVSPEIAGRLRRNAAKRYGFQMHIENLWTKQYTRSRISRALLHILLGITKEQTERLKQADYIPFLRVLGFSKAARSGLLPALKRCAKVPVVTRPAAARDLLCDELYYSDFYYMLQAHALRHTLLPPVKNELEQQIVIV